MFPNKKASFKIANRESLSKSATEEVKGESRTPSLERSEVETLETRASEESHISFDVNNAFKFKIMMIGSMASGKSDMMARYYEKNAHEMFLDLTNGGMI